TASLVIEDVTTAPPISMRTCAVVWPFFTSTILPLMMLRALNFMRHLLLADWGLSRATASLPFGFRAGQQRVEFGPAHINLIELAVEVARRVADIALKLAWEHHARQPLQPDPPVDRRRCVDPAIGKLRADKDAAAAHGVDRRPGRIRANVLGHRR